VIAPLFIAALLCAPLGLGPANAEAIPRVRPVKTFTNVHLRRPIQLLSRSDEATNLYVLEQPGRIVVLDTATPDMEEYSVFMDLRDGTFKVLHQRWRR
jgi:hypothetical protein